MNENENVAVEATETTEVTENGNSTEVAPVEEQKSLLAEIGEWVLLALIIGLIWKLCNLIVSGGKKVIGKIKAKVAAKKAAKQQQAQPTEAPVAAPVAAPEATQTAPVNGEAEQK